MNSVDTELFSRAMGGIDGGLIEEAVNYEKTGSDMRSGRARALLAACAAAACICIAVSCALALGRNAAVPHGPTEAPMPATGQPVPTAIIGGVVMPHLLPLGWLNENGSFLAEVRLNDGSVKRREIASQSETDELSDLLAAFGWLFNVEPPEDGAEEDVVLSCGKARLCFALGSNIVHYTDETEDKWFCAELQAGFSGVPDNIAEAISELLLRQK